MSNGIAPEFDKIDKYESGKYEHDWHSYITIKLGELIEDGWINWYTVTKTTGRINPTPEWEWDYYDVEQYKRVCDKINARFYFDEISLLPPAVWKQNIIRKMNEIMPKYKMLYKALEAGVDPLQVSNKYGKSRNIYSEFPETLLSGNSDYVSNGTDREYEDIEQGDWIEKVMQIAKSYQDVDVMILDELECMFSGLYTPSVNGW